MANNGILFALICSFFILPLVSSSFESQVYIVYFGEHKGDRLLHEIEEFHHSYLEYVKGSSEEAKASLLYSYKHSINGFAARLTPDEAAKLSDLEEVVSVIRSHPKKHVMQTTRSWEFMGMDQLGGPLPHWHILSKADYGTSVIVGLLDSGFWPESVSFNDEGMGPIPKHWKGICQTGHAFNSSHCNRKVIGARYYIKEYESFYKKPLNKTLDYLSPRDADGHGSHTASIAAGRQVPHVSFMGTFAGGTASGGAPLARLAIYKACWAVPGQEKAMGNTCFESDMLAALDDAIADGVHVISISIGALDPLAYSDDGIAIGAFHAIKKNITVVCAAGNSGPAQRTLSNTAPWILTVGASTLDRDFPAPAILGNGKKLAGSTVTPGRLSKDTFYPLVFGPQAEVSGVPQNISGQCMPNTLSPEKAKGKIVFCLRGLGARIAKGDEARRAGAVGYILGNPSDFGESVIVDAHVLPATAVGSMETSQILEYINSTANPVAMLVPPTTRLHVKPAPSMASFTSRGPSVVDPYTLKPDITAPGVGILAAWSMGDSVTKLAADNRTVAWNFESGTSMACPHAAGAAALVKAIHPHWSPAAIRSAIMTTAGLSNNVGGIITDAAGNPADPFQFGSGHLRPTKAVDPGLVYDASYEDYLLYLCSGGFPIFDPDYECPKTVPKINDLNYPSIAIPGLNGTVTVKRTVTNVGSGKSVYFASVKPPVGYKVKVSPSILSFSHVGEKKSFDVTVEVKPDLAGVSKVEMETYGFGWLSWRDGYYTVRSPIAVFSAM
ncbi:hypothetical protein V2J09_013763 [Rumex salicifolius]